MFNILVTGSDSQLAKQIKCKTLNSNYSFFFKDKTELNITDFKKLENFIIHNRINILINCAAYTNVSDSEKNINVAFEINCEAVENIGVLCSKYDVKLIHISTDYVFDGSKNFPYLEDDLKKPLNVYGNSKLQGEMKLFNYNLNNSIIIRTSWLYSKFSQNFITNIIKKVSKNHSVKIVKDELGTLTFAGDLADVILEFIPIFNKKKITVFHYSNSGVVSREEIVNFIKNKLKSKSKIETVKSFDNSVNRPRYSALSNKKIKNFLKIKINNWDVSLQNFLMSYEIN